MRPLKLISILFLLSPGNVVAQTFERIDDSTKTELFNGYAQKILQYQIDSIPFSSLPGNYRLVYLTSCPFTETIMMGDSGSYNLWYGTGGKQISMTLDQEDSTDNIFGDGVFTICLENVEENIDTLSYNIAIVRNLADKNGHTTMYSIVNINKLGEFISVSFNSGKYIILTQSGISSVGSQTSYGRTLTYFLEKI